MKRWTAIGKKSVMVGVLALGLIYASCPLVFAQQSQSPNYQINEAFFGTGGDLKACSGGYCSKQSAGELTVGNSKSGTYQIWSGFNTNREPSLIAIVEVGAVDLGVLNVNTPRMGFARFTVLSYLAGGYVVQIAGQPLKIPNHTMPVLGTATASVAGSEQFGMNLVTNTAPLSIGANPSQDPDFPTDPFGFGTAAPGYNTANQYKFTNGDIIAQSPTSSGTTRYTLSYLANTSPLTPAGTYTADHSIVVTATF